MINNAENFHVITGGPGAGKTTLLNELSSSGFRTIPEEARRIIKEQMETNGDGLPWKNKQHYAKLMFDESVKTYLRMSSNEETGISFFDRGIIDTFCYMDMENLPMTEEMNKTAYAYRYHRKVFILPPWKEIYENDSERKQSWEEAVFTFKKMKETYLKYGYEVIEVPKDNVGNRKKFILDSISRK